MFGANLRNMVNQYLSVPEFQAKWRGDQRIGSGYFYALTYPPILSFFREHRGLSEALDMKVALVYSWNPKICEVKQDQFAQAKSDLESLEGSVGKELSAAENILTVDIGMVVSKLWGPVKRATSSGTGVSVTKFLHFTFPDVFPMIDSGTMDRLGGGGVNPKWYSTFLSAWKDLYGNQKAKFDEISDAINMRPPRVLDAMIFSPR